jgi:hypothetical protein
MSGAAQGMFDPDPKGRLPSGELVVLPPSKLDSPILAGAVMTQDQPLAPYGGVKALRRPKQKPPRAKTFDQNRVLHQTAPSSMSVQIQSAVAPLQPMAPNSISPQPIVTTLDGGGDDGTTIPPDTQAAFSKSHGFNPLNNNIHIFKLNDLQASPTVTTLNAFWGRMGCFDPKVTYDPQVDRFYFVSMSDAELPTSSLMIAVSTNGDPTGSWSIQSIAVDAQAQGNVWMDYPSLGLTADKVTVQVNLYTFDNPGQFAGSTVYVFDKASLTNSLQTHVQRFTMQNQGAGQVPAITYDAAFSDQFLVSSWGGSMSGGPGALAVWRITGSPANQNAALALVGYINGTRSWDEYPPVNEFAPQSGIHDGLDSGDDRLLSVIYRSGALYCCHTVCLPAGGPTRSSIQWWSIPVATWVPNVGLLDDPTHSVFYSAPSLAMNGRGDICIGHAQFSKNMHASGSFLLIPAAGAHTGAIFAAGQNTYVKRFNGNKNRWGDYSATQPDPRDTVSFWTIQEYASAQADVWASRIAHVKPP